MTPKVRKFRLGALALIGAEMLAISATALSGASRTPERNAPAVARTAKESVLYSFSGTDGEYPTADVIQGSDGNFYGTTSEGGPNFNPAYYTYGGTVFRLTPSGTLTTLYSFCSLPGCADGEEPQAGVIQGSDGNFYGTTFSGGEHGMGTVFKLTPSGTLTTLYSFCTQLDCTDGSQPYAGVIQGSDGNLYGTTESGGKYGPYYAGTVFKLTPSGTLTTLHSFTGGADGGNPYAGLIQGSDGNFYGTTAYGGRYQDGGTVFQLTPSGTLTTLYPFCTQPDCTDGMYPRAGVIQGSDGNFYGTTFSGGNGPDSNGTVFKLTPSGKLTTLYWFCKKSDCTDGNSPYGGVIQGSDGNFYGTTRWGGANHNANAGVGGGTLFKLTPSGALTILYSFCSQPGCTDGLDPYAGVIKRSDGNFYGTTYYGGAYGAGTVFQLSPSTPTPTATPTATVTMTATPPSTPTDTPTKTPTATQTPTSTARLRASPDKISFGRVDATGVSKARKVTVINASKSASAVIGTISPTVTSFAIVAGSDLCSGQTLAPKNTCTFELNFQPSTPGAVSDMLAIPFNGSPEPQISLKGTGVRVVLKGPKSENLGTAVWGSSGKVKNLSIRNPGSVSVILGIPALGGIDAGSFTIPGLLNSRLNICSGQTLAPKGKCEIPLEFTPPNWHPIGARGEQFGRLSVPYTYGRNSGTYSAALSGTVK